MSEINSLELYLRQVFFLDRGVNVFWTIQVEVFFYFCFVAFWVMHSKWDGERCIAFVLFLLGLIIPLTSIGDGYQWIKSAHLFIFGMLLHLANKYISVDNNLRWTTWVGFSSLLGLLLSFPQVFLFVFGVHLDPWNSLIPVLSIVVLIFCVVRDDAQFSRVFSCRPARFLGRISYSMYLLHYFVLLGMTSCFDPSRNYFLNFLATLAAVLIVSWASNRWIEVPLQRFLLWLPRLISSRLQATSRAT